MKVLKYILIASLPILLFVNLWQYATQGASFQFKGFKSLMDYGATWHGFDYTYAMFINLSNFIHATYSFGGLVLAVLIGFAVMMSAPILLFGTVISDIIANIIWFFGWIFMPV